MTQSQSIDRTKVDYLRIAPLAILLVQQFTLGQITAEQLAERWQESNPSPAHKKGHPQQAGGRDVSRNENNTKRNITNQGGRAR